MENAPERIFIKKGGKLGFAMQISAGLVSSEILWVLLQTTVLKQILQ